MGASSVTGTGLGECGKPTLNDLAILANGPSILVTGRFELDEDFLVNPPSPTGTLTLNPPLPGSYTNYVVQITGINTGWVYIAQMSNDDDGNFEEFRVIGETEGDCMYVITKVGVRPTLPS